MGREVILCADDYGLSSGVCAAIRDLAERGSLSAVSCMANGRAWPDEAMPLRALAGQVEVGLHLTLTELAPLGPMPRLAPDGVLPGLERLLAWALRGRLLLPAVRAEIAAEWQRQYDAFGACFGRPPDFVDGHQHVHQLPGARGVLLGLAAEWARLRPLWVRSCGAPPLGLVRQRVAPARALVVAALAIGHRAALYRRGLPTNRDFRGVRAFDEPQPYAELIERFLRAAGAPADGPRLVMCHPGQALPGSGAADAILGARIGEHAFLASDGFAELLARLDVTLAPFPAIRPPPGGGRPPR